MALEDISTPEAAVERIKKLAVRIEQDIARYNLGEMKLDVDTLEQLCSFLLSFQKIALNKRRRSIALSSFDTEVLLNMEIQPLVEYYLPLLKFTIDRIYPDENMYNVKIPFVKNQKQEDCIEQFWKIIEHLKIGAPEQQGTIPHETIFTRLGG